MLTGGNATCTNFVLLSSDSKTVTDLLIVLTVGISASFLKNLCEWDLTYSGRHDNISSGFTEKASILHVQFKSTIFPEIN